jgi:hypothetical protein
MRSAAASACSRVRVIRGNLQHSARGAPSCYRLCGRPARVRGSRGAAIAANLARALGPQVRRSATKTPPACTSASNRPHRLTPLSESLLDRRLFHSLLHQGVGSREAPIAQPAATGFHSRLTLTGGRRRAHFCFIPFFIRASAHAGGMQILLQKQTIAKTHSTE